MKITDVTLTLFAWDNIPSTTYGTHTGQFAGNSALGLLRLITDQGIEGHAFLGSAMNSATTDGQGLITHLKLDGATASLVHDTFGSASANALAASIAVAIGFLLWGIGIGQIYQDVYARAWGIEVGSAVDQWLFAIFFFVLTGAVALVVLSAAELRNAGWLVLLPVWIVGSTVFWLWVPRFLLHRKIGLRALLPGALLATILLGGTTATAPFFLAAPVNANGKAFGSFGVVVTIIGYVFVMITMSLVCAVFSPVWANWRKTEREHHEESSLSPAETGPVAQ